MRPFRGSSGHPTRSTRHRCAFATRATPGIHASTTSAARS